jgi:transposase
MLILASSVMRTGRPTLPIVLTTEEQEQLEAIRRRAKAPQAEARRARVILGFAKGLNNKQVCAKTGLCAHTVGRLRKRFHTARLAGLFDLPRSGAPRTISDEKVAEVVRLTLETKPKQATHWSTRSMAERSGLSNERVHRIWKTFGLQPHRSETFQLSTDPQFVEKVRDVVGLYMTPPQNALVLCLDEKSQIQALERSQPIFPLTAQHPERHTSDYFRHGTTSLFAALDVASGEVHACCQKRHRQKEFLVFLKQLEAATPKELPIHAVLDNYAAHKTAKVRLWIARHPRWHLHFIPTHSSWLNQVERFFAKITGQRIRRESFRSVEQLRQAILDYIEHHNKNPKPFKWTAPAELILSKVGHFCKTLA